MELPGLLFLASVILVKEAGIPIPVPGDLPHELDHVVTTDAVIRAEGRRAAGTAPPPPDIGPFLALQEWLALAGERRVIVPFGEQLAHLMLKPKPPQSRLRRDFKKLVSCVKTMAFLRQCQRERAPGGEVLATIEDYASVRELLLPSFKGAAAESVSGAIRQTVEAIETWEKNVSETDLVVRRGVSKQTISVHVRAALADEWLRNEGPPWRRPYRLKRGLPLPTEVAPLPEVRELQVAVDGIPAPVLDERFRELAFYLPRAWPQGVRASELAERLGWERRCVREGPVWSLSRTSLRFCGARPRARFVPGPRPLLESFRRGGGDCGACAARPRSLPAHRSL